jgi:peptidoglycan/xylan/chitin deacetylase (PgdA/CDA1 family)
MGEVIVLCYHAVSETWETSEAVTPEALERQLLLLKRRGWRSVTFSEAATATASDDRTMAITFDDALRSVKELAFPILSSLGLTATVFVPTAHATTGTACAWSGLDRWLATPHAGELTPMSWDDIAMLADSGWEIGSHTCTHPRLTQLDDTRLACELVQSREASVPFLGHPLETIAYPYGDTDERVAAFARRAGYSAGAGLSSDLRLLGRYRYPRIGVYRRDSSWRFRLKTTPATRRIRAARGRGERAGAVSVSPAARASTPRSADG